MGQLPRQQTHGRRPPRPTPPPLPHRHHQRTDTPSPPNPVGIPGRPRLARPSSLSKSPSPTSQQANDALTSRGSPTWASTSSPRLSPSRGLAPNPPSGRPSAVITNGAPKGGAHLWGLTPPAPQSFGSPSGIA